MKDRKLATRYARALLASLPKPALAEEADQFLSALRDSLRESASFRGILYDPAIPRTARKQLLRTLADEAGMPSQMRNFLATIVEHNRVTSLPSIAQVFHEERESQAGIVPAEISTAFPLPEDLKARTLETLERLTGRKVRLTARHDPALIGGAVTRVGSKVYDGSLRSHLEQLRREMSQE